MRRGALRLGSLLIFASVQARADVLWIGDSHSVGSFGSRARAELQKAFPDERIVVYASCGSTLGSWLRGNYSTKCGYWFSDQSAARGRTASTPRLESLLAEIKPRALVIQMGTNYLTATPVALAMDLKWVREKVENIAAPGLRCFWIGPPDSRRFSAESLKALQDRIQQGTSCAFFDSLSVTSYPSRGGDGIHFDFEKGLPVVSNWISGVRTFLIEGLK